MKPLYAATAVREGLGPCLRPGGLTLTERVLETTCLTTESVILDAGCGTGESLAFFRNRGYMKTFGVDRELGFVGETRGKKLPAAQGDLSALPIQSASIDLVLCECVWNLTPRRKVLEQFARVLRPGGLLAISDIYRRSHGQSDVATWPVACCFAQATDLATVLDLLMMTGFDCLIVEDHTRLLKQAAAAFIFAHGSLQEFWYAVTGDMELAAAACTAGVASRPGLFLIIARKIEEYERL